MPPVSVTMQPWKPVADAEPVDDAPPVDELDELDEPLDGAELLLPHAATTSVADTASAAVAHALSFTLPPLGERHRAASLNPSLGCPAGYSGQCRQGRGHAGICPARCRIGTRS
jgi:hypothetical protein